MNNMSKRIIDRFAQSSAKYLKVTISDENTLELQKRSSLPQETPEHCLLEEGCVPQEKTIISNHVGIYKAALIDLAVGTVLREKALLGNVNSMGIEHGIKSPFNGVVKEILIKDGDIVEYGQALFVIKEQV